MRAVARASGLKLGALQSHYRTRDALLAALAEFIGTAYPDDFTPFCAERSPDSRCLYEAYLTFIEAWLIQQGASNPRGDALSMLEGLTLFVDPGRRWEAHAEAAMEAVHAMLLARYGAAPGLVR